jgi:tetratricopeptide (TPR) repeat protein
MGEASKVSKTLQDQLAGKIEPALVLDRPDDALAALREARDKKVALPDVLGITARRANFNHNIMESFQASSPKRLQRGPASLLTEFASWLSNRGEDAFAVEVYSALLGGGQLDVDGQSTALALRARSLERSGEIELAEPDLLKSITLKPDSLQAEVQLALLWADRGGASLDMASTVLARAAQAAPTNAAVLAGQGWVRVQRGDIKAGVDQLERATKGAPRTPRFMAYLAEARRRSGRPDDARRLWQEALALSPDQRLRTWIEAHLTQLDGAPVKDSNVH